MTKIPIDQAPAGAAMDAAVAEVMGWKRDARTVYAADFSNGEKYRKTFFVAPGGMIWGNPPPYSDDIAEACDLIESQDGEPFFNLERIHRFDTEPEIVFWEARVFGSNGWGECEADTAELAICRAFLKAHGVTEIEGV